VDLGTSPSTDTFRIVEYPRQHIGKKSERG
jgi:hypothetical protein